MLGLGFGEMVLIVVVIFMVFGAKRIPELARGLGEGIRNFKGGLKDADPPRDRVTGGDGDRGGEENHPR
jgi:sec-independent protein translocase protein TatA